MFLMNTLSLFQMDPTLPPVQKLVVPAAASVSGNRSVSFRPTLTPGGLSRTLDRTPRETVSDTMLPLFLYMKCHQQVINTNCSNYCLVLVSTAHKTINSAT